MKTIQQIEKTLQKANTEGQIYFYNSTLGNYGQYQRIEQIKNLEYELPEDELYVRQQILEKGINTEEYPYYIYENGYIQFLNDKEVKFGIKTKINSMSLKMVEKTTSNGLKYLNDLLEIALEDF